MRGRIICVFLNPSNLRPLSPAVHSMRVDTLGGDVRALASLKHVRGPISPGRIMG